MYNIHEGEEVAVLIYSGNISIVGVLASYYKNKLYINSKSCSVKNSVKKILSELYSDEVSGNIKWNPLDIKETSTGLYLIFYGAVDYKSIESDYAFKTIANKLTSFEKLALDEIKGKVKKLQPDIISQLLGNEFLIRDLFGLYKALVDKKKDRANFYKLVRKKDYIVPVGRRKRDVYHRPPQYFKIR